MTLNRSIPLCRGTSDNEPAKRFHDVSGKRGHRAEVRGQGIWALRAYATLQSTSRKQADPGPPPGSENPWSENPRSASAAGSDDPGPAS
jgi:hypothetical protein